MQLGLTHSYAALGAQFHTAQQPAVPPEPQLLLWNAALADELGLDSSTLQPVAHELFSGRKLPDDARPISMAYAGHQYAHFVPALVTGAPFCWASCAIVPACCATSSSRARVARSGHAAAMDARPLDRCCANI